MASIASNIFFNHAVPFVRGKINALDGASIARWLFNAYCIYNFVTKIFRGKISQVIPMFYLGVMLGILESKYRKAELIDVLTLDPDTMLKNSYLSLWFPIFLSVNYLGVVYLGTSNWHPLNTMASLRAGAVVTRFLRGDAHSPRAADHPPWGC